MRSWGGICPFLLHNSSPSFHFLAPEDFDVAPHSCSRAGQGRVVCRERGRRCCANRDLSVRLICVNGQSMYGLELAGDYEQ